jgi:hypothetical protein
MDDDSVHGLSFFLYPPTRWRREVNSNFRYRFLNCQTTHVRICDGQTNCPYRAETTILSTLPGVQGKYFAQRAMRDIIPLAEQRSENTAA